MDAGEHCEGKKKSPKEQATEQAAESFGRDEGNRGAEDRAEGGEGIHHSASTALIINVETMEHRDSVKDLGVDGLGVNGLKGKGGEGGEGSEPHEVIDIR